MTYRNAGSFNGVAKWQPLICMMLCSGCLITPLDPFFNANTMDDIAKGERLAVLDGG